MKLALAAIAAIALLSAPAGAATIVQNGSFENIPGPLSNGNWGVFNSIPSWYTVSGGGIEIQTNPTLPTIDAQDGNNYVELDSTSNSSMEQLINLGVGRYILSFFYSPRNGDANDNGIDYGVNDLSGLPLVVNLFQGNVSGPSLVPATAVGLWTRITGIFNVTTAGQYQLKFAATGTNNSLGGLIDNVSVASVPVPAAG
ncbi:MAG: hypothetical protein U1D35_00880, partial [Paracoccaceae bacterium]|nr:hypothetical protein [Paracoccaceae bacterium]